MQASVATPAPTNPQWAKVRQRAQPGRVAIRQLHGLWHLILWHPMPNEADDIYLTKAGDTRSEVLVKALRDPHWDLSDVHAG